MLPAEVAGSLDHLRAGTVCTDSTTVAVRTVIAALQRQIASVAPDGLVQAVGGTA